MITNIRWPRWRRSPIRDAGKSSAFRSESAGELLLRVSTLMWSIYALHCPLPRGHSMMISAPRYTLQPALARWILSSASASFTKQRMRRSWRSESWMTWPRSAVLMDAEDAISSLGMPTLLLVRSRFVTTSTLTSHRPVRHRCRPCLRRERKFTSSAQTVLSIILNLIRADCSEEIARLALQERLSYII